MSDERTDMPTETDDRKRAEPAFSPELVNQLVEAAKKQIVESERTDREFETREEEQKYDSFLPPQVIPDPKIEPGYAFRWIRTGS